MADPINWNPPDSPLEVQNFRGIIPIAVMMDQRLSHMARVLYAVLEGMSRVFGADKVHPSQEMLAKITGQKTVRSVQQALSLLEACGYVKTIRRRRQTARYEIARYDDILDTKKTSPQDS